jgi:DNA repair protein RAD5
MGKTIMISALIQTGLPLPSDVRPEPARKSKQLKLNASFKPAARKAVGSTPKPPSATLIVAPTSLLAQWAEELQRSSKKGTLDVLVWHGQNRLDLESMVDEDEEVGKPMKIVITSYGTLASEHAKSEKFKSPIFESTPFAHGSLPCFLLTLPF